MPRSFAGSLPRFGQTMNLEVSNLSAQGGVAFLALCFVEANPGIDLTFVGAPTGLAYVDFQSAPIATLLAATAPFSYAIPNNAALAGTNVINQALGQDPTANALGFKFSNGVRLVHRPLS
ncbi:MAG: hypothetical protein IPK26_02620 [Planctomycetes bacterium]|nr:hypothetical protein [Planctomycetota bacterium]